jgi:nicotinate-nucleotide pyrophosphorylase (carboxylating)
MDRDTQIGEFLQRALQEDVGEGDHTSQACISPDSRTHAHLLVKDDGIIAGVEFAAKLINLVDKDARLTIQIEDGAFVEYGSVVFDLEMNTRNLLMIERILLNAMQRMSAIATLSHRFAVEVEDLDVKILDTRKTTPLIRFMEKWAVRIGGCHNYRNGLFDWIMIKDNHVDACGGIREAIEAVQAYLSRLDRSLGVTLEVRNLVELHEALEVGSITRIMLDNFEIPILREAVATVAGAYETEASGGVTLRNVRKIAKTGVDYISVGALTHSPGNFDLSLKVRNKGSKLGVL